MSRRSNKEPKEKSSMLEEAQKYNRPQTWRIKQTADKGKPSTNIDMVFILPVEFRAPYKYE